MRAVASIGENRSKLYATVIVHYFLSSISLSPLLLPSFQYIYIYMCVSVPSFSFHVTRMFAKKEERYSDIKFV